MLEPVPLKSEQATVPHFSLLSSGALDCLGGSIRTSWVVNPAVLSEELG